MTASSNSTVAGCLARLPALGLDEEDADVRGLDEGLLDGSILVTGKTLNRFLQALFSCVSGLDGKLFRPRWQPEPPNLPKTGTNWAALGITGRRADVFPATVHSPGVDGGSGFDTVSRNEELDILTSFYGPDAESYAYALRDGLQLAQNHEPLLRQQMGLVATGDITSVPSLTKNLWLFRVDLPVTIRRRISAEFAIFDIASAQVELHHEEPTPARVVTIDVPTT